MWKPTCRRCHFSVFSCRLVVYSLRPSSDWENTGEVTTMMASLNRAMQRITKGNPRRQWILATALCGVTLLAAQWARAQDKVGGYLVNEFGKVTARFPEE